MAESDKGKPHSSEKDVLASPNSPLVFISHDGRDAELAEAFSKLLRSVSAGMLKTFNSSDKKGTEGIDFGDEWYKRLMSKLQTTSHVVCLFTERSVDRPWILYEAGIARARLDASVFGIALGVPLSRVATGPFYHFHNSDDSEADLTKLVHQLAKGIPNLELDPDVVKSQVTAFKAAEEDILKKISSRDGRRDKGTPEENSIAKLVEEMKALPSRVAERLNEGGPEPARRRKSRRFHPMVFERLMHMMGRPGDPVGILMAASLVREDAPWMYELAMEVYRAVKSGDPASIKAEMEKLHRFVELTMHGPFMEEFSMGDRDTHMLCMEFPRMLEHMLERSLHDERVSRRRRIKQAPESS